MEDTQKIWDGYMDWFHHSNVWKDMHYHGIRTLKMPSDMWNYQEIIFERRIDYVIETGTRHGGSALFFADTLMARHAKGCVITVDNNPRCNMLKSHQNIHFLIGDSGSPEIAATLLALLPDNRGSIFMILDSDHSRNHVFNELTALVPILKSGDYLVVEDTNVNGHPILPDFGPGPWEAIHDYINKHPNTLIHDAQREQKFGATAAPKGYYIKV
jgi:cephalosporin hydroxylase